MKRVNKYLDGALTEALNGVVVAVVGGSIQHLRDVDARQGAMVVGGEHAEVRVHGQHPRFEQVLRTCELRSLDQTHVYALATDSSRVIWALLNSTNVHSGWSECTHDSHAGNPYCITDGASPKKTLAMLNGKARIRQLGVVLD